MSIEIKACILMEAAVVFIDDAAKSEGALRQRLQED